MLPRNPAFPSRGPTTFAAIVFIFIGLPFEWTKDSENRRVPFDPQGRLAKVLKRRAKLGASAFVFGSPEGEYQDSFNT
jgi:hypothetical protein